MPRNGRTAKGQFAKGNAGGPGRPRRPTEMKYLAVLADGVNLDDWRAVVRKAVTQAKAGDAKARDWLAKHLIGDEPAESAAAEIAGEIIVRNLGPGVSLADLHGGRLNAKDSDNDHASDQAADHAELG